MRQEVRIARRYAKALVEVVPESQLESLLEQARRLGTFVDEKFVRYMRNPVVTAEKKIGLMSEVLEKLEVFPELKKVLLLMGEKDRLGIIKEFISELESLINARLGIVEAEVISARELDSETEELIKKKIEEVFGKKAVMTTKVDPSLIGGVVIRIADRVIDASVKTQLENLKKNLMEV